MQQNTPTSPIVRVQRRVVIQAPLENVFGYAADLRNDHCWRQEVHSTDLDTHSPRVGTLAQEDSYLSSRMPHALNQFRYTDYVPGQLMRCATVAGNPTWTVVERRFCLLSPSNTVFIYTLQFERKVVQQALGVALPLWFLRWYTGLIMKRYLKRLKSLLENASRTQNLQSA